MTQASIVIANGGGASVRAAINSANEAMTTKQGGSSAPSTTYPYMDWADTANDLLKQRNAANSAWITKGTLSAAYGGLPASSIIYAPGSPSTITGTNVQAAIQELEDQVSGVTSGIFSAYYDSGLIGITSAGGGTISHGLGGKAKGMNVFLRCKVAASGYSIGDEVAINHMVNTASSNTNQGVSIINTTTDFVIKFGSNANVFLIIDASTGATASQTNGNWEMIIRAWA
jgi:hypothetical protein